MFAASSGSTSGHGVCPGALARIKSRGLKCYAPTLFTATAWAGTTITCAARLGMSGIHPPSAQLRALQSTSMGKCSRLSNHSSISIRPATSLMSSTQLGGKKATPLVPAAIDIGHYIVHSLSQQSALPTSLSWTWYPFASSNPSILKTLKSKGMMVPASSLPLLLSYWSASSPASLSHRRR
jgi:hypothetical protein